MHHKGKQRLGAAQKKRPGNAEDTSHRSHLSKCRTLSTTIFGHALFRNIYSLFIFSSSNTPTPRNYHITVFKNCVNAPIGILNTQSFVEHQIKDFRENAHTHYFGCHRRTHCQWYRNLADRYPSFPLDHIDHHVALTFAIVFGAAIPEACYCLPCLCIVLSLQSTIIFLCPSAPKLAQ